MRKAALILGLMVVAAVVAFLVMQQARQDIHNTIQQFFSGAGQGKEVAADYLDESFQGKEALLKSLADSELFFLEEIEEIRLQSFNSATVSLVMGLGEDRSHMVEAQMARTPQGWKISSFPELALVPVAIVLNETPETVTFLTADGLELSFNRSADIQSAGEGAPKAGMLVGVGDEIAYFAAFTPGEINKLLTVTEATLEGELAGFLPTTEDTAFFRQEEGLHTADRSDLIVGMENLTVYWQDDLIKAVTMPEEFVPQTIRAALNTTDFRGLLHENVQLSGQSPLTLEDRISGNSLRAAAGVVTITASDNEVRVVLPSGESQGFDNRLYITADSGRISIDSLSRGNPRFTPSYAGHLEVRAFNGQLQLVNEVPLDTYLYSVVPSEMPVSFGVEPLKVQAVAARSYAVSSIYRSGFRAYAAHVDDSVSSQVYNNVPEYPESTRAVNETSGRILTYGDAIADTRFFSTSSGVTANFEEVWHDPATGAFPASPVSYLVSGPQLKSGSLPDVSGEEGARKFFTSGDWDSYDKASPWFRWEVEMTREELEDSIKQFLPERQRAQSDYVLTEENGRFVAKEIPADPLGKLEDLRVIQRGEGGNIMELEIAGENGTYRLLKEYTIRFTLRPVRTSGSRDIILKRHDGSTLSNYTILPSTFMVLDIERDNNNQITNIRFRGGGNGHGVGMSQFGVRGLAENGYNFEQILAHFYPGTVLEQLY
ncbi:SpoIID/LytB domain-containing protein [Dethiobacter alkaliphilus]|uniref:SpoIID/LytB domain protein n=1 Tax=Dethiobacter alkaliphilus AHT 1 TaxID=555088 RepID=C0GHN1_DETAL|nr:SpoIID/LytB domain-containing protein [Dethiobacter alkaliphilus]EEG77237.1 SpoIID/LytB domain protein [Dethiobacter alkaliphilus AHT 1]